MSNKMVFEVNKKIEIELEHGVYKSVIQDVNDDYIGISIPVNNGQYLPLKKGESVRATYYFGNDVYKFSTVVIGRKIEKILLIMLKIPDKVNKMQRRGFVRVPLMLNVYCATVFQDKNIQNINNNQIEFFDAYSLDISGGGMRLAVDRSFETKVNYGDILLVTISLPQENLTIRGKIVRIENDKNIPKFICGLSFIDLDQKSRETIIGLVFATMREQMKKGAKGD
ncbi:flagellar brake protein [Clostridium sp. DJ247]|uniref:flagellar brake protein n=1 Tax=Clostridium sp. DJ247 TaxID=2726188 RepID=UPI0016252D19|nr:flagellar brake domain-containing protein [Clostridium sp. DJ247]MBC2580672.1 flagellar protein [Clostridium sp. DJ247]MBC2580677.1 flagellar protein [Clostridium sp. DJ247]